jgi:hypothetical protein
MRLAAILLTAGLGLGLGACATSDGASFAWDRLNQPGMDLERSPTPNLSLPLTRLDDAAASAASGGCRTCAK